MSYKELKNNDVIFSTGVFLRRDSNVNGGWVVEGFEGDEFFNGEEVKRKITEPGKVVYYVGDDDDSND